MISKTKTFALFAVAVLAICAVVPVANMDHDATDVEELDEDMIEKIEDLLDDQRLSAAKKKLLKDLQSASRSGLAVIAELVAFAEFLNTLTSLLKEYGVTPKDFTEYLAGSE